MSENSYALSGLVSKRAELAQRLKELDAARRQLIRDIGHLDAVIGLLDPDDDARPYAERIVPTRNRAPRGEVSRVVLVALREAEGPLSSMDLTLKVMEARGLYADDLRALKMTLARTTNTLRKMAKKGVVERHERDGRYAFWSV